MSEWVEWILYLVYYDEDRLEIGSRHVSLSQGQAWVPSEK